MAIGLGASLASGCRKKVLFKRALRLGISSNIELPVRHVDYVMRFLRRQSVAGTIARFALCLLIGALFSADHDPRFWARWLQWLVIALPLFVIVFTFLMTVWPRWHGTGALGPNGDLRS